MDDLLREARNLSELLLSSTDLAREIFEQIAAGLGVPVSVARALCLLEKAEPMSALASKLRCDKSYVTQLTDQMESLGFVERVPGFDRRTKMIELTHRGKSTRDNLESQIALLSPAMNELTKAERQTLGLLLEKISIERTMLTAF
jgi:DNA-binding MarR family transcriptional regulator